MHEYGMCEAVVAAILERARGRRVARVRVHVGVLHRIEADAFAQSFARAAAGTTAAGATAELVHVPVRGRCRSCDTAYEGDGLPPICPTCQRDGIDVSSGDELVLESIEYRRDEDD